MASLLSRCWRTDHERQLLDRESEGGRGLLLPVHVSWTQRPDAREVQVRMTQDLDGALPFQ